ncbi:succinate semialdehyde dehydrogenase NADP+ linked [Exophiala xenobiotica]|nr:succinate semialdehyde dehydrogenase NADP+ linked [Exophiala xenobiotica]
MLDRRGSKIKYFPKVSKVENNGYNSSWEEGYGAGIAKAFAAQGAKVIIADPINQPAEGVLKQAPDSLKFHKTDVSKQYENGRPITGALQEIDYAASFLDWFAGEAERSYGCTAQGSIPGIRFVTIQQPVGVVGVVGVVGILTPWNFPSAMITRKIGGAIAAGCSVVIKPAAETPYPALALAKLGEEAGLPAGVMNVITTDKNVAEVGKVITTHEEAKKISFTGSTGVGKLLMQ